MKHHFIIFLLCLYSSFLYSQNVGIGTNSPNGALDIVSTDNGLLVPRLALVATNNVTPLATPVQGELIFNTSTSGSGITAVSPGFYFWEGTSWVRLKAGSIDDTHAWYKSNSIIPPSSIEDNIYTNGSVGIGIQSPAQRLAVYPGQDVSSEIGHAHIGYVGFGNSAGFSHINNNNTSKFALVQTGDGYTILNSASGEDVSIRINNSPKAVFEADGDFGVGTSNPASKVEVVGDIRLNGNNAGVIYQNKETNKDWRLVYVDKFEVGPEGWIGNGSLSSGDAGVTRQSASVAGLVGSYLRPINNDHTLKKYFNMTNLSYSEVKVEFNYLFLDSWDTESGWMAVKSGEAGNPTQMWYKQHNHDWGDMELNGTNYNVSFFGNGSWSDTKHKGEAQFSWSGGGFWIEFGANLDGTIDDETFGIDNIAIYVR